MPWSRLITMIGMLVIVFMIMNRAQDPRTWHWLTNEYADPTQQEQIDNNNDPAVKGGADRGVSGQPEPGQNQGEENAEQETSRPTGPTDLDPEELDAAQEEFQAVSDRQPLLPEETPSYRRLLDWVKHQSGDLLRRRSQQNVFFTDFAEIPDKRRGRLVHLRLHVWGVHVLESSDN